MLTLICSNVMYSLYTNTNFNRFWLPVCGHDSVGCFIRANTGNAGKRYGRAAS